MNYEKEIKKLRYSHVKELAMKIIANQAVVSLVEHGLGCSVTVSDGHDEADEYFVVTKRRLLLKSNMFPDERSVFCSMMLNRYFLEEYVQKVGSLDGLRCTITGAFDIR